MKTIEQISKELKLKYDSLLAQEENGEIDFQEEWKKVKEQVGVVEEMVAEYNWGEGGVLNAFKKLINIINEGRQIYILEDLDWDDNYLIINKEK